MKLSQPCGFSKRTRPDEAEADIQLALFDIPPAIPQLRRSRSAPRGAHRRASSGSASLSTPFCPCAAVPAKARPLRHPGSEGTVRLFDRLYTSFRIRLFDCAGSRYGQILREAEREVRFLNPDFDTENLTEATAPGVLELVEATIRRAPFLQRSQLRKAACLLVADLYEKHYDALAATGALARLEDIYYRLKR